MCKTCFRDLAVKDIMGSSDPFVRIIFLDENKHTKVSDKVLIKSSGHNASEIITLFISAYANYNQC